MTPMQPPPPPVTPPSLMDRPMGPGGTSPVRPMGPGGASQAPRQLSPNQLMQKQRNMEQRLGSRMDSTVSNIPAYQKIQAMGQQMQGRAPTPQEMQQLQGLQQRVENNPRFQKAQQQAQQRVGQFQQNYGSQLDAMNQQQAMVRGMQVMPGQQGTGMQGMPPEFIGKDSPLSAVLGSGGPGMQVMPGQQGTGMQPMPYGGPMGPGSQGTGGPQQALDMAMKQQQMQGMGGPGMQGQSANPYLQKMQQMQGLGGPGMQELVSMDMMYRPEGMPTVSPQQRQQLEMDMSRLEQMARQGMGGQQGPQPMQQAQPFSPQQGLGMLQGLGGPQQAQPFSPQQGLGMLQGFQQQPPVQPPQSFGQPQQAQQAPAGAASAAGAGAQQARPAGGGIM